MRNKVKQIPMMIAILVFASFLNIACTPARRPVPERNRIDINERRMTDMYDNETIPDNYGDRNDLTYDNIPNNLGGNITLEKDIERMTGIRDAVIILNNNTAYVGIEADTTANTVDMKSIQTNVASKIRERMPNIARVYITSEMDRVERLRSYKTQINRGKSVKDLVDQIEDLF